MTLLEKYNGMLEALQAVQHDIGNADVLFDPNPQRDGEQERYDRAVAALQQVNQALLNANS